MSKVIATEAAVHLAADRLHGEGQEVTIEAVRALVGGGSQTTVLRHLQRWREMPRRSLAAPPMPTSVLACFDSLKSQLWDEMWSLAASDLEAEKGRARAEEEAARLQAAEALELSERTEGELDKLRDLAVERDQRLASLESQLQEAHAVQCLAGRLEAELGEHRRAAEQAAAHARQEELLSATLRGEISALENQLGSIEMQRTSEQALHLARVTELERKEATATEAAMRQAAVEQELSACRAELSACRAELAVWRGASGLCKPALANMQPTT